MGITLPKKILTTTDWEVYGMDIRLDRLHTLINHKRMHFQQGDITIDKTWIEEHIQLCDVVIPLVAIATPSSYVKQPLRVFELDFEANLPIISWTAQYKKHLIFPSSSEVYGLCEDEEFDTIHSNFVYGAIHKTRWIYACSKQLLDRVIWGYGMEGLQFTLFRPFNWIGVGLDSIHTTEEGSSRVLSQFFGHILRGETITLVDGGNQKRTFTYIHDGIAALMHMIENKHGIANGKIYNIGNPANNYSIRELAKMMIVTAINYPEYQENAQKVQFTDANAESYYGEGYQDMQNRIPKILNTCQELGWQPTISLEASLKFIFEEYRCEIGVQVV